MGELLIFPAIVWGIVVGIYELAAIHADESFAGARWLSHGLQAAFFSFIFVFITMNIAWALDMIPALSSVPFAVAFGYLPVRILVGIVAIIKIQAASMVVRGGRLAARGVGEHLTHTIIAGLLIVFAPEIMGFLWPPLSKILPWV